MSGDTLARIDTLKQCVFMRFRGEFRRAPSWVPEETVSVPD
jgi:hypothetical protein